MNTKNALLMSAAAAALIAGAGVASAQAPTPAPTAQQIAPNEKTVHESKGANQSKAPDAGMKTGKTDDKTERKTGNTVQAQDNVKPDVKPNGMRSETKSPGKEIESDTQKKADMRGTERTGEAKARSKDQGAGGERVKLSTEQHMIMINAVKQHNSERMKNVDFPISVGSRVPRTVHFYPMPEELVHFYPHWRGYDYFLVGEEILVVNPRTHEIVAVLEA